MPVLALYPIDGAGQLFVMRPQNKPPYSPARQKGPAGQNVVFLYRYNYAISRAKLGDAHCVLQ